MNFEYDPNKSRSNLEKHGIDFEEAQALWDDPGAITADTNSETEQRFLVIGRIHEIFWTAVITYREGTIRIISVRRSRKHEVSHYGQVNYC